MLRFTSPDHRAEVIKAALWERGVTYGDIARKLGVTRGAVSQALFRSSQRIEQAIADALDVPVPAFPSEGKPPGAKAVA